MSFSSDIKNVLCSLQIKKNCCKNSALYGMLYPASYFRDNILVFATDNENVCNFFTSMMKSVLKTDAIFEYSENIRKNEDSQFYYKLKNGNGEAFAKICSEYNKDGLKRELLLCDNCTISFLRGLFIACGTVTNPEKGYHLEISFKSKALRDDTVSLFEECGFSPKSIDRKEGAYSLYFKNSESIEDFLTYIGAPHAAVDLMNVKIMRDIRNNENRRSNCDTANIFKSTEASAIQLEAIKKLTATGRISLLPADLRQTANLRMTYPEYSMAELARLHEPPLTKSGISHRMKKIIDFSAE